MCCNSEPMAPFFDLMIVGEGESVDAEVLALLRTAKKEGWTKREFLVMAAQIGGVYVPSLYLPEYDVDGTLAALRTVSGYQYIAPGHQSPQRPAHLRIRGADDSADRLQDQLDAVYYRGRPGCP